MIDAALVWYQIGTTPADLPDADLEVLVYDEELDDTVVGALDYDGEQHLWNDSSTGKALPAPKFWAHKPYPDPQSKLCHPWVRVGRFAICNSPFGTKIWVQSETGEGGDFPVKDLEKVIETLYREKF